MSSIARLMQPKIKLELNTQWFRRGEGLLKSMNNLGQKVYFSWKTGLNHKKGMVSFTEKMEIWKESIETTWNNIFLEKICFIVKLVYFIKKNREILFNWNKRNKSNIWKHTGTALPRTNQAIHVLCTEIRLLNGSFQNLKMLPQPSFQISNL